MAASPPASAAKHQRLLERSPPAAAGGLGHSALHALPEALSALFAEFPPEDAAELSAHRLEELEDALRSLTEITRAGKDAKRAAAAAAHNAEHCLLINGLLSQDDVREVFLAAVPYTSLCSRLGPACKTLHRWVMGCTPTRGVTAADVAAMVHVPVLRHLCTVPGATVTLSPGRYQLGDARNADHLQSGTYSDFERSTHSSWKPGWRSGFGPLAITGDNVTLVGGAGVELGFHGSNQGLADAVQEVARSVHVDCSDFFCMLTVRAQGTKLLNCRLQQPRFRGEKPSSVDGVCSMQVWDNSSVEATSCEFSFIWTGANCTATFVDCRIEGSCGCGLNVARNGDCRLMRCHVTANRGAGVWVSECGSVSAQECDVSDNGQVETNALGHSNLGGGFAGEAGSHIVLKGGAVTRNVGVGVSTKGLVHLDSVVHVFANGRGDFLEEAVPKSDLDVNQSAADDGTTSRTVYTRPPLIGHVRSGTGESSGFINSAKMATHVSGVICGVDAARVSNELCGKIAPLTLDSCDDRPRALCAEARVLDV